MTLSIDELESEIWSICVMQRAAQDEETINRWQTNELSHLKERFLVQPLPLELKNMAHSALIEWQQLEKKNMFKLRHESYRVFELI